MVRGMWRKGSTRRLRLGGVAEYDGHVPLEVMVEVLRTAGYTVVANGWAKRIFREKRGRTTCS